MKDLPETTRGRSVEPQAGEISTQGAATAMQRSPEPSPVPASSDKPQEEARPVEIRFLEGLRVFTQDELAGYDITRYQVTRFYQNQIHQSGSYEQLKHIVEPSLQEFRSTGSLDTSGEHEHTVVPGLQHKYPQTGLLLVTDKCASYCRYCFRKRIVGKDSDEVAPSYTRVGAYIRQHPEMNNVLLSGGDPFVLTTEKLHRILDHLLPCPNLTTIRFGTKMFAFYPPRFADPMLPALFQRISHAGKTPVIVVHFDHFSEVSPEAVTGIRKLRAAGVQFLNQAVLLGKVNDDAETLAETFRKCHEIGARPYYLFQARPVKGASHFQVSLRQGVELVRGANQRLSGIQKTFRYIMSHYTGKIEILDLGDDNRLYMRYHQNSQVDRIGRVFSRPYLEGACWLDGLPEN